MLSGFCVIEQNPSILIMKIIYTTVSTENITSNKTFFPFLLISHFLYPHSKTSLYLHPDMICSFSPFPVHRLIKTNLELATKCMVSSYCTGANKHLILFLVHEALVSRHTHHYCFYGPADEWNSSGESNVLICLWNKENIVLMKAELLLRVSLA